MNAKPTWSLPEMGSGAALSKPTVAERRLAFRAMHEEGCFVLPNPHDVGSALCLERLGFPALATTTAGVAWGLGLPDGAVSLQAMLDHIRTIAEATGLPVNADIATGLLVPMVAGAVWLGLRRMYRKLQAENEPASFHSHQATASHSHL